jgi:hypothetical protein
MQHRPAADPDTRLISVELSSAVSGVAPLAPEPTARGVRNGYAAASGISPWALSGDHELPVLLMGRA